MSRRGLGMWGQRVALPRRVPWAGPQGVVCQMPAQSPGSPEDGSRFSCVALAAAVPPEGHSHPPFGWPLLLRGTWRAVGTHSSLGMGLLLKAVLPPPSSLTRSRAHASVK